MQDHAVFILEETCHVGFTEVLSGGVEIGEHLLELDMGYPAFILGQYTQLRQFSKAGKQILQVEPYLERLLSIQHFLAEDHNTEEIESGSIAHSVYSAERDTTGRLIDDCKAVRGDYFRQILSSMNSFAKADAAWFVLRDSLRASRILEVLISAKDSYIEAGSIHLLLYRLLGRSLSKKWHLQVHSIDRKAIKILSHKGSFFSPGDELTLSCIGDETSAVENGS